MTDPLPSPSPASSSGSPLIAAEGAQGGKQLGLIGLVVVVTGLSAYFGLSSPPGSTRLWLTLALPTIALAAVALLRAHNDGELEAWMRPTWGDFTRGFATTLFLFGAAYVYVKLIAPSGTPRDAWMARLYLQLGDPSVMRKHAPTVAFAIIALAASGEIVWRGLVTTLFAEQFGSRYAWVMAAVAYAVASVPSMWALRDAAAGLNPVLPLAALGGGLVWGALARFYNGRVFPGIVSHALFAWCVLMMFRLWGPSV